MTKTKTATVSAIDKYGNERTYTNLSREWFKVSGPSADDTFIGTNREGNRENINRYMGDFDRETWNALTADLHAAAPLKDAGA